MRLGQLIPFTLFVALIGSPAIAQDYWEYEPLEGEWEHHQPTLGLETEYEDDGDVNVEREGYEWEAGEGYHEEEWYDPSDWFDDDSTVDYEDDTYDYGYYDDYYSPYYGWGYGGYGYDYYDYDYDYAYDNNANNRDVDYEFGQQLTGRVEGLQRMRASKGAPQSVRLKVKTEDGQSRTLHLGDLAYVSRYFPKLKKGDEVVIGGEMIDREGRKVFQAREMRAEDESYLIPRYEYRQRIEGELQGLKKVRMRDGNVEMVVATVRTDDGKKMDVRLGEPDEMASISRTMSRGAKVRAEGYRREVNGKSSFVVQDFKVVESAADQRDRQSRQQTGDRQRR